MLVKTMNDNYLDVDKLTPQTFVEVKAYLVGTMLKTDKTGKGFATFYVRDVNGKTVSARRFNMEGYIDSGFTISSLKKKPVLLKCTPDIFNGSICLIVREISLWEGEFDYSRFLNKLDRAEEILVSLNTLLETKMGLPKAFDLSYVNSSYLDVCDGLVGGYVKLIQMMVNAVSAYNGCPGVDTKELMFCMTKVVNTYSDILSLWESTDVRLKFEEQDFIYDNLRGIEDIRLKNICADALNAIVHEGSPQHLYAHIIADHFKTALKCLSYSYQYPLVVRGSVKKVGDEELAKY